MAIIANTFLTYDAVGNRERLANIIYRIAAAETPAVSMLKKTNEDASLFEWQTESLDAVDGDNVHLQGDDLTTFTAVTPTVRVGNRMQISRKDFIISGTQEAVNKAGRKSDIAHETEKKTTSMKRDIEKMFFANQIAVAGNSTTQARSGGLGATIKTNVDKAGDGTNPTWTSGVPSDARNDGTTRAFTETILKSAVQTAWTTGANVERFVGFLGPYNKGLFSAFAGVATKTYNQEGRRPGQATIVGAADVYVSNFGTFRVLPSRWSRERDGWLLDFEYLELAHLRPFKRERLSKSGDAEKFMLIQEYGYKVLNESAHALCADLSTS